MATMKTLNGYGFDSAKLGGKAPEYYLNPKNLLDNSDFTRFIAQAGIMGTHGAVPYAGDRWKMNDGTVTGVANAEGDGYTDITLQDSGRIEQVVAGIDKYYGQPMTAAIWLKNGSVIVGSAIVNAPTEDYLTPISVGNGNTHIYLQATTGDARVYLFIILTYGNPETVVAAALLPGSYTAETLPPYVPKGYAAELEECRRYFRRYTANNASLILSGFVTSGAKDISVHAPELAPMRTKNVSIAYSGAGVIIRGVSGYATECSTGNAYGNISVSPYQNNSSFCATIDINKKDGTAWGLTNNTPVVVNFVANGTLDYIADL